MPAWIVTKGEYSDEEPMAVFTSFAAASTYARRTYAGIDGKDLYKTVSIREVPLNPEAEGEGGLLASYSASRDSVEQFA